MSRTGDLARESARLFWDGELQAGGRLLDLVRDEMEWSGEKIGEILGWHGSYSALAEGKIRPSGEFLYRLHFLGNLIDEISEVSEE